MTRAGTVRREWAALHPRLRTTVVALLGAGTVLALLGAAGDAAGMWSRLPFLTNLASSLTGALFGIPVAVVVVQRLLRAQSEADERAAAWRLAMRSVHAMRVAAVPLARVDADVAGEVARLVARCDAALAEADAWAERAFAARPRPRRLRASMYQRTYLRHVLTLHETARRALDVCTATGLAAAAPAVDRIRSEAVFLHDHVRPTVLRLGGQWLPQPYAEAVERADDSFPAVVPHAGVERLLDAVPAAQLAALLPEPDASRAGLADPDVPMPLPSPDQLRDLCAALAGLLPQLDRARRITATVDGLQAAVDRLAEGVTTAGPRSGR